MICESDSVLVFILIGLLFLVSVINGMDSRNNKQKFCLLEENFLNVRYRPPLPLCSQPGHTWIYGFQTLAGSSSWFFGSRFVRHQNIYDSEELLCTPKMPQAIYFQWYTDVLSLRWVQRCAAQRASKFWETAIGISFWKLL